MSVKFEKEQVRVSQNVNQGGMQGMQGMKGMKGKDETTAHKIGEALTGGNQQQGYLAVRPPTGVSRNARD